MSVLPPLAVIVNVKVHVPGEVVYRLIVLDDVVNPMLGTPVAAYD